MAAAKRAKGTGKKVVDEQSAKPIISTVEQQPVEKKKRGKSKAGTPPTTEPTPSLLETVLARRAVPSCSMEVGRLVGDGEPNVQAIIAEGLRQRRTVLGVGVSSEQAAAIQTMLLQKALDWDDPDQLGASNSLLAWTKLGLDAASDNLKMVTTLLQKKADEDASKRVLEISDSECAPAIAGLLGEYADVIDHRAATVPFEPAPAADGEESNGGRRFGSDVASAGEG